MTWRCPKCLRRNPDDADDCTRCGREAKESDRYE